jgi:hypothetical protein
MYLKSNRFQWLNLFVHHKQPMLKQELLVVPKLSVLLQEQQFAVTGSQNLPHSWVMYQ